MANYPATILEVVREHFDKIIFAKAWNEKSILEANSKEYIEKSSVEKSVYNDPKITIPIYEANLLVIDDRLKEWGVLLDHINLNMTSTKETFVENIMGIDTGLGIFQFETCIKEQIEKLPLCYAKGYLDGTVSGAMQDVFWGVTDTNFNSGKKEAVLELAKKDIWH